MWAIIRDLVSSGTTLLLTTQYLEEADELADEIVVIDHGQVIAAGTAETLKDKIGGDVIEFGVVERRRLGDASVAVRELSDTDPVADTEGAMVAVRVGNRGSQAILQAVRNLDAAGIEVTGLALRRPSLDDVFLALTGHQAEEDDIEPDHPGRPARPGGHSARRGGR